MTLIIAILTGFFFGLATWMLLQKSWFRILFGVILLSHAANLAVLSSSGSPLSKSPPITSFSGELVDPLPQALLLTAIVIGFAVIAFFISLLYRLFNDNGESNLESLFLENKHEDK